MKTKKNKKMYEVEKIKNKKRFKDGFKYLVKWEGFSNKENTWFTIYLLMQFFKGTNRKFVKC